MRARKLDAAAIAICFNRWRQGESFAALARYYRVSETLVRRAVRKLGATRDRELDKAVRVAAASRPARGAATPDPWAQLPPDAFEDARVPRLVGRLPAVPTHVAAASSLASPHYGSSGRRIKQYARAR